MLYSPLRYPGGKGKLSEYIKSLIKANGLCDGIYVEPYAGGAGIALDLLIQEYASHIHINDIDPAIYDFWYSVLNYTDELSSIISSTRVSMAAWRRQKEILANPNEYSILQRGFATFFLNRTNRSGILKAGVIGGQKQSGKWKMDCRYNKSNLIERISSIALYKERITLHKKDAIQLIQELYPDLPNKAFMYLDPPYYVKGKDLYRNFYTHNDHVAIEKVLRKLNRIYWLVSYDNIPEVRRIYRNYRTKEYSLSYTAQNKYLGSEIMIYSSKMKYSCDKAPYIAKYAAA